MRPSQVEEGEGWEQAVKFNDLGDSFSWVMGQTPGGRGLGDKLVVGLVKGRRETMDSFKQRPGQGKESWGESVVRRRLKIKKGLVTYIMQSTWMRWFSFSAGLWCALPELSWQVRKQVERFTPVGRACGINWAARLSPEWASRWWLTCCSWRTWNSSGLSRTIFFSLY